MYDVFWYDGPAEGLVYETYQGDGEEAKEDDYSSNDEDNPKNDYPDDADHDYNEFDYYREWEDDETREMFGEFEKHCLRSRDVSDDDTDDDEEYAAEARSYAGYWSYLQLSYRKRTFNDLFCLAKLINNVQRAWKSY